MPFRTLLNLILCADSSERARIFRAAGAQELGFGHRMAFFHESFAYLGPRSRPQSNQISLEVALAPRISGRQDRQPTTVVKPSGSICCFRCLFQPTHSLRLEPRNKIPSQLADYFPEIARLELVLGNQRTNAHRAFDRRLGLSPCTANRKPACLHQGSLARGAFPRSNPLHRL